MQSMSDFCQIVWGKNSQYVLHVDNKELHSEMREVRWLPRKGRWSKWHWIRQEGKSNGDFS